MSPSHQRVNQIFTGISEALKARSGNPLRSYPVEYKFITKLSDTQVIDMLKTIGGFRREMDRMVSKIDFPQEDRIYNTVATGLKKLLSSYQLLAMLNDELKVPKNNDSEADGA